MSNRLMSLNELYARFDAVAKGREQGNSPAAHEAILVRFAANRRVAETDGWTSCALERAAAGAGCALSGFPLRDLTAPRSPTGGGSREVLAAGRKDYAMAKGARHWALNVAGAEQ
jgi:hypothetical protein